MKIFIFHTYAPNMWAAVGCVLSSLFGFLGGNGFCVLLLGDRVCCCVLGSGLCGCVWGWFWGIGPNGALFILRGLKWT